MHLLFSQETTARLSEALRQAGPREIGGVLMGEHVAENTFRVMEITIQRKHGTFASFLRLVEEIVGPLRAFFQATKHEYTRFNYIGEWHSHHAFELTPSTRDHASMLEIIHDPQMGAHFVALVLIKLDQTGKLVGSVTVYQPGIHPYHGQLLFEEARHTQPAI